MFTEQIRWRPFVTECCEDLAAMCVLLRRNGNGTGMQSMMMMMIAFITFKSSLVPFLEGL